MAEVKLTGNTRDAQQKIQKLRREVQQLDREAKKPKNVNVQGKGFFGKMGGTMKGGTSALAVAGGNIISQIIQGMLTYIPALVRLGGGLLGKSLGLHELERAVTKVTPKIRNLVAAIETFSNPGEEALTRADKLDALDDERRSHNSRSLAEEYAYSKAFSNIAGVNGTQIVDRLQAVLDMATSGNVGEMEKAWGQLQGFGITYDDIQNKSTWQVLAKMLKAYGRAGADGNNELEPAMQQIVGKRQLAAVRKIGDGKELEAQARTLRTEFDTRIQNPDKILTEAAKSEVTRAIAEIQGMAVPTEGLHYINDEANTQLSLATLKTGMIGDVGTAGQALLDLGSEMYEDIKPALDEIQNFSFMDLFTGGSGSGSGSVDNATITVDNANVNLQNAYGTSTLGKVTSSVPTSVDDYKKRLEMLPIKDITKKTEAPTTEAPTTEAATSGEALRNALLELNKTLKDNTASTKHAADVFNSISVATTPNYTQFQ